MTEAEKIQVAADIITSEMREKGVKVEPVDALRAARLVHRAWDKNNPALYPAYGNDL